MTSQVVVQTTVFHLLYFYARPVRSNATSVQHIYVNSLFRVCSLWHSMIKVKSPIITPCPTTVIGARLNRPNKEPLNRDISAPYKRHHLLSTQARV